MGCLKWKVRNIFNCLKLQAQLERIAKVNADLRRKNSTHKKQARALIEEKVDLETQLHTKDAEVEHIKKIMVEQEKYDEQRAAVKAVVEASKSIEEEEEVSIWKEILANLFIIPLDFQVPHFNLARCHPQTSIRYDGLGCNNLYF